MTLVRMRSFDVKRDAMFLIFYPDTLGRYDLLGETGYGRNTFSSVTLTPKIFELEI